jgi:hypothetical protein
MTSKFSYLSLPIKHFCKPGVPVAFDAFVVFDAFVGLDAFDVFELSLSAALSIMQKNNNLNFYKEFFARMWGNIVSLEVSTRLDRSRQWQ